MALHVTTDYREAAEIAANLANEMNRPIGLEKAKEYGRTVYRVGLIPTDPAKRAGWEIRCEVVNPGTWQTEVRPRRFW